jgi:hypothetical protein
MVQRRENEKGSRYIQEASAPVAVTVYQTCNIMYLCSSGPAGLFKKARAKEGNLGLLSKSAGQP